MATGTLQVTVPASPEALTAINIAVTRPPGSFLKTLSLDKDPVTGVWSGDVLDVPPNGGYTVTAAAFVGSKNTFTGEATDVTVYAGTLTTVPLKLKPVDDGPFPGKNTPPHISVLTYPAAILSTEVANLSATADDPDAGDTLTYTWTTLQGEGTFTVGSGDPAESATIADQDPGDPVALQYHPVAGFTGFAVIQLAVTDQHATTITTFPIAIGAGLSPLISFDVLPNLTVEAVDRQMLMPGGQAVIHYDLVDPNFSWAPATMHVNTSWSDSCGGTFTGLEDTDSESVTVTKATPAFPVVTYTAPSAPLHTARLCTLTFTMNDGVGGVEMTFTVKVWIDPPMTIFVSSSTVQGGDFLGQPTVADAFCQGLADSAPTVVPSGRYVALLTFNEIDARDRLVESSFILADTNRTKIARNKAELFGTDDDHSLLHAINVDDQGNSYTELTLVYTGSKPDGTLHGDETETDNCNDWTVSDASATGEVGDASTGAAQWSTEDEQKCSTAAHVYCVQQPLHTEE